MMIGPTPFRATRNRYQMLSLLCALLLVTPTKAALHHHQLRQLTSNEGYSEEYHEAGGRCESIGAFTRNPDAAVFINFSGDPTSLDESNLRELEAAFFEAFDTASSDNCFDLERVTINTSTESFDDDHRRALLALPVNDEDTNNHRHLEDFEFNFPFTLYFEIIYNCNGCPGLFGSNDGSRRRNLKDEGSLPTREEFNQQFNQILSEDSAFLDLQDKVQGVKATSELNRRQCFPNTETFHSDLVVVFEGDFPSIDKAELLAAEEAVRKAYNIMNMPNPYSCDTKFRKVKHATFLNVSPNDDGTFSMSFALEYECRGCELGGAQEELFDEKVDSTDVGRSDLPLDVDFRELGPQEPDCSCDKLAQFERAPTVDEFVIALQTTLDIRRLEGKINVITDVVGVGEQDDEEEYCCSHDYKTCSDSEWCNKKKGRCERNCNGHWMEVNDCPAGGLARWQECTHNRDGCCSPATCRKGNPNYWQCL